MGQGRNDQMLVVIRIDHVTYIRVRVRVSVGLWLWLGGGRYSGSLLGGWVIARHAGCVWAFV